MQSRQGYPDQPDVISHRRVAKNTKVTCIRVQYNPVQGADETAACLIRFEGEKRRLKYNETIRLAKNADLYLECLGGRPTECDAGLWLDGQ